MYPHFATYTPLYVEVQAFYVEKMGVCVEE
jgi:hypothetical protein